jgi:hypothetical protein
VTRVFYTYIDLTLEDVPRAFYVGKGVISRVRKRERNVYWQNITAKYGWRREVVFTNGEEQSVFAKRYEVVQSTISRIVNRKRYA